VVAPFLRFLREHRRCRLPGGAAVPPRTAPHRGRRQLVEAASRHEASLGTMDAMREMMDSLMGTDRNAGKNEQKKSFKDDDICKHHLVWQCPHDMFVDTQGRAAVKSPIGPCRKKHSEAMRDRFKQDPDADKFKIRWLKDLLQELQRLTDEVDVKISRDKKQLRAGTSCSKETAEVVEGGAAARELLIKEKMEAAERMAAEGDVELSRKVMEEAEALSKERKHLARVKEMADTWVDEICEICGRQISWRAPEEIEARKHGRAHPHEMGTFHEGWARCRQALIDVEKELSQCQVRGQGEAASGDGRRDRSRSREPRGVDRPRERDRNGDGRRERDREGERRERRDRDDEGAAQSRGGDRERRGSDYRRTDDDRRDPRSSRDERREDGGRRASPDRGRERRERDPRADASRDEGYRDRRGGGRSRSRGGSPPPRRGGGGRSRSRSRRR